MAPLNRKNQNNSSSRSPAAADNTVNVLASCYLVDSVGTMKGLHYCSTILNGLPSPPSSPPLAAITPNNELAILPKPGSNTKRRDLPGKRLGRRGGAALAIREECERFFCETMKAVFHGERKAAGIGSSLMGAYYSDGYTAGALLTPPSDPGDGPLADDFVTHDVRQSRSSSTGQDVVAWLEFYHWASGVSFRAFVTDNGDEKSLFAFLDPNAVLGRELKSTVVALMELADYFGCANAVTCIDRRIPADDAQTLIKGLQWANFELTTLDHWAGVADVVSDQWVFMGCDI